MFQRDSWRLWAMAGVVASGAAAGDIPFRPTRVFIGTPQGGGVTPSDLRDPAVADLDNDGDLDILGVEKNLDRTFWLENVGHVNGQPHFVHRLISDSFEAPSAVHAMDLDEDGDFDILVASEISGLPMTAWLNDGSAKPVFVERPLFQVIGGVWRLVSGDLDGDGDIDLLTCHGGGDDLRWHERVGTGPYTFVMHTVAELHVAPGLHVFDVCMVDLDNNGRTDLVSALTSSPDLLWHRRTEDTGVVFEEVPLVNVDWGSRAVVSLDLNLDGAPDLVYCSGPDDRIVALLTEDGVPLDFSPLVLSQDPDAPFSGLDGIVDFPEDLFFGDLDLDGDEDLVVLGAFDDQIVWFERTIVSGVFHPEHHVISIDLDGDGPLQGFSNFPIGGAAGDIDGDGDIDLVIVSDRDESITVWENRLLCREDIDGSGLIDFGDVNAVVGAFNTANGAPGFDADADLDGDGAVGFADLNVLLSFFNSTCGAVSR